MIFSEFLTILVEQISQALQPVIQYCKPNWPKSNQNDIKQKQMKGQQIIRQTSPVWNVSDF